MNTKQLFDWLLVDQVMVSEYPIGYRMFGQRSSTGLLKDSPARGSEWKECDLIKRKSEQKAANHALQY